LKRIVFGYHQIVNKIKSLADTQ